MMCPCRPRVESCPTPPAAPEVPWLPAGPALAGGDPRGSRGLGCCGMRPGSAVKDEDAAGSAGSDVPGRAPDACRLRPRGPRLSATQGLEESRFLLLARKWLEG